MIAATLRDYRSSARRPTPQACWLAPKSATHPVGIRKRRVRGHFLVSKYSN